MADDDDDDDIVKALRRDFHKTFEDGIAMGAGADGVIKSFPLSELAERTAARDAFEKEFGSLAMEPDDNKEQDNGDRTG